MHLKEAYGKRILGFRENHSEKGSKKSSFLEKGWVLANHIFMSIHVAFLFPYYIERILETVGIILTVHLLPTSFGEEVITGLLFALITGYVGIGIHERGHYLESVRQITLNEKLLPEAQRRLKTGQWGRLMYDLEIIAKTAPGKFPGIKRAGLSFYVDAPFNLAVAAAGPRASRNMAIVSFPICVASIVAGVLGNVTILLYMGRIFMGLAVVGYLDYKIADPGHYKKYTEREKAAALQKEQVKKEEKMWIDRAEEVRGMMRRDRIQEVVLSTGKLVRAPWGFRNSGMGGRHTEKEYPESNISMQEAMFIPLTARNYEDAQRMTVELQTRLMQIIEKTEGCRVMGIGLEGGLATYINKDENDLVPEQKLWRLMKQSIEDLGLTAGVDVAIAFDPAASELENAYREKFEQSDIIGTYLFWRDKEQRVMSREDILNLYKKALEKDIPIVSIEDGFAEDDDEGWAMLMEDLGGKLFVIGDDFITTNDRTIESKTEYLTKDGKKKKLLNAALIKANQIGTLTETTLAMLTSLGKGLDLIISHRSKSPNDDMEAQISIASMALGLKAGGGANTERLFKYGSIIKLMKDAIRQKLAEEEIHEKEVSKLSVEDILNNLVITGITAYEEATNAGIPTVGVKVNVGIEGSRRFRSLLVFTGSTPLGTSAGTGEAIHLVDSIIEASEVTKRHIELFSLTEDGTYRFRKEVTDKTVHEKRDAGLTALWEKAKRYSGKGCLNAVANVEDTLSKVFLHKRVSQLGSLLDIDNMLMNEELKMARQRGKIKKGAGEEELTAIMQRKGNLGMNAMLSMSLALGRLVGAVHGKDLWEVIRDQMEETMAKVIVNNGGKDILPQEIAHKVNARKGQPLWEALREGLSFDELVTGLQAVNDRRKNIGLYELLRKELPVYGVKG